MKIVMITPDCYMIDRRILLEARSLIKAGHSVTLLAGFECSMEEHYISDGIDIYRYKYDWDDERLKKIREWLPNNDKIKSFFNRAYMYIARRLFEINPFDQFMLHRLLQFEADVYHVHDLPCLKVGYYAARERGVPLIYDAHELYYAQEVLTPTLQKRYFEEEKKYIRYPDIVITVNPFIARLMAEHYQIDEPKVIMNCTETPASFDQIRAKSLLRKFGNIPLDWRIVLYQGWISSERNIETLVKGVKYFPKNTCLAIIGYGAFEDDLKNLALKEKVDDRVFFLGKIPSEEMLNYSVGADLGVIPYRPIDDNHLYCSPNKLFEYVLAGVPIISDDLPFFKLMSNKYGFIRSTDMGSPEAFGKTIGELLASPELINALKRNCHAAAKELNWDVEGQKLLQLYNELKPKKQ